MSNSIVEAVRKAGVVGAGGAGFPTHIKMASHAGLVIANGAECEPLLCSDRTAMRRFPDQILSGLRLVMESVGAGKGIVALKSKHADLIRQFESYLEKEANIDLLLLDDFYPAGDEFVLVQLATGRSIPEGGIPLDSDVLVDNVITLQNIHAAVHQGQPVTDRLVTVAGAVAEPGVFLLPIGTGLQEAVDMAGGAVPREYSIIEGGPIMGKVADARTDPVTKTTSGIIVLPEHHTLVQRKKQDLTVSTTKARSICCQCTYCTELCPRNLLGHRIEPHKILRSLSTTTQYSKDILTSALLCSECGLCGYYSCVHDIQPFQVNRAIKAELQNSGFEWPKQTVSPMVREAFAFRKVPTERLIQRLDLKRYVKDLDFVETSAAPRKVTIPLKQHIGEAAVPTVKTGDHVQRGDRIGDIKNATTSACVHAAISGRVTGVADAIVIEAN